MIRPVSRKRAALLRIYAKRRDEYLEANPACQRCGERASEVHHAAGRSGLRLIDPDNFRALCHDCHIWATEHPLDAIRQGLSKPRHAIDEQEAASDMGGWDEGGAA